MMLPAVLTRPPTVPMTARLPNRPAPRFSAGIAKRSSCLRGARNPNHRGVSRGHEVRLWCRTLGRAPVTWKSRCRGSQDERPAGGGGAQGRVGFSACRRADVNLHASRAPGPQGLGGWSTDRKPSLTQVPLPSAHTPCLVDRIARREERSTVRRSRIRHVEVGFGAGILRVSYASAAWLLDPGRGGTPVNTGASRGRAGRI